MKRDREVSERRSRRSSRPQRPPDRTAALADDPRTEQSRNEPAELAMDELCQLDFEALRLLTNSGC